MKLFGGENVAERFRGKPIRTLEVGGRPGSQLRVELASAGRWTSNLAQELLADRNLQNPSAERVNAILVQARDFGVRDYERDYNVVTHKAQKEGLALCPQLTGPELALLDTDLIENDMRANVLSKPVTDRGGNLSLFELNRDEGRLKLDGRWTDGGWSPGRFVVARLR